jgi:rubrerythrin
LPALTAKDRADLAFVGRHGHLVALSFVQHTDDVEMLLAELARLEAGHLGVVLKIETQRAFRDLPRLLIAAMAARAECVMLNKGPYIRETLRFVNDVLGRMQAHHDKKTALLRKLSISEMPTPVRRPRTRAAGGPR